LRIFYSWQSDTAERGNHYFIRDALRSALVKLATTVEFDERPALDHDTQGVPGTPPIFETILKKIESAGVFVADVTFVASTKNGKAVPNPNVLIELGYAMKALGSERYLLVMNEFFGAAQGGLPFDLGHLRWPIRYTLDPNNRASDQEVQRTLVAQLANALRVIVDSGVIDNRATTPTTLLADRALFAQFLRDFPSTGAGAYFLKNQDLGASFRREELSQIFSFLDYWDDAGHEFFNAELEAKRRALYDDLRAFSNKLGSYAQSTGTSDVMSIGIDDLEYKPHLEEARWQLNDMSTKAYERHQELVRTGRRVLGPHEAS